MKKFTNSFAEDKYYNDMENRVNELERKLAEMTSAQQVATSRAWRAENKLELAIKSLELTECDCGFFIDGTPAQCIRCKALEKIKE